MTTQPQKHPLMTYFEAKGYMKRKPYIMIIVALFVFTILTQLFGIQQLKAAGVDVSIRENVIFPLWINLVLFIASLAVLPAIIMRARDAAWPAFAFGGLFAFNLLLGVLNAILGVPLPTMLVFVVNCLAFIAIVALMIKPTN